MLVDPFVGLDPETRLLGETVRAFARDVVAPGAIERDETERFDRGLVTRMAELGLLAGPFPEAVGGAGLSAVAWTVVVEEVAAADMALAVTLAVHVLHQNPVVRWGTDEQRARWLPALQAGEALGSFALTESGAGSDAAAIRMRADRVGPTEAPSCRGFDSCWRRWPSRWPRRARSPGRPPRRGTGAPGEPRSRRLRRSPSGRPRTRRCASRRMRCNCSAASATRARPGSSA